jgi:hypothetical protein
MAFLPANMCININFVVTGPKTKQNADIIFKLPKQSRTYRIYSSETW